MKYFFLFACMFCGVSTFGQNISGKDIIIECIKEKVQNELKNGSKLVEFDFFIENQEYIKINDTIFDNIKVHFLPQNELRVRSKKGLVYFGISPFIIEDNSIGVIIMKEFYKKRRADFLNKSIYFFKYNCEQGKFVLNNVNHQLW